jgi:hypothetical protein
MRTPTCPSCKGQRHPRHLLCRSCWDQLPGDTRQRLTRRDDTARLRLRQLRAALTDRTPLAIIRVSR